ncbi:MAG TPA: hypothetical protein VGQ58_04240 [Candidatus Limnocylindrales bacterium]|nr:hypothetical protein [Candidatus Limnocylindrales bacterium]
MSRDLSPVYGAPSAPGQACPRCGRIFEAPITVEEIALMGHIPGDPRTCVPLAGVEPVTRDTKARRSSRRKRS